MKVGIIGAGIAGLASAVRMACREYEVHVFEANEYPGGKLTEFVEGDYRFDAGPSLFTMPSYVEALFHLADKETKDYFEYERLPIVCNYFWEDGTRLSASANQEQFAKDVNTLFGISLDRIKKVFSESERKYLLTGKTFLENSLHKTNTWLTKDVAKAMLHIPSLDLFQSMNRVNEKLLGHPKLVQLFNRYATYNGSNPYKAPGLLNIIPHFEYKIGAYFPKGGMISITQSIFKLAKDLGVQFHFNQKVDKIAVENKKAIGLKTRNKVLSFDQIICNMDIFFAYQQLLTDQKQPKKILSQQKSTSALIFYWGIEKSFPELDLHNILFSDDYKKEFEHLEMGRIYHDPTIYINISNKFNEQDSPANCENWFTMINVPYDNGQDWDQLIEKSRVAIIKKINRILKIDLESLIACEKILDPRGIQNRTSSHLGALYGTSSNDRMAAFFRHPNFSNQIKNLYFCGGSVHPGGGIPLCLLSAKIVDDVMHG